MPNRERAYYKYYIPFVPSAKINYYVLFLLYDLAEYNKITKCYDTIKYKSLSELAKKLDISESTLKRILKNTDYDNFIKADKANKTIYLLNNFSAKGETRPFVCLSLNEL